MLDHQDPGRAVPYEDDVVEEVGMGRDGGQAQVIDIDTCRTFFPWAALPCDHLLCFILLFPYGQECYLRGSQPGLNKTSRRLSM